MELYFNQNGGKQSLEVVFYDRKKNLGKVTLDLESQKVINTIYEKKLKWGNIKYASFDKKNEEIVILNGLKEVVR